MYRILLDCIQHHSLSLEHQRTCIYLINKKLFHHEVCVVFDHHVWKLSNKQYTCSIQMGYNNKPLKVINTGSNTMNLVLHIQRELNQTTFIYFRPCNYVNYTQVDLMHAGIASNVPKILTQFIQTCKIFTRLKRIHNQLRLSYEEIINESLRVVNLLTH